MIQIKKNNQKSLNHKAKYLCDLTKANGHDAFLFGANANKYFDKDSNEYFKKISKHFIKNICILHITIVTTVLLLGVFFRHVI